MQGNWTMGKDSCRKLGMDLAIFKTADEMIQFSSTVLEKGEKQILYIIG